MKRAAVIFGGVLLFIAPLYARCWYDAALNLDYARKAKAQGEILSSIEYYRRAVGWRAPFNMPAFEALAEFYEYASRGIEDRSLKLQAFRELRSAVLGSRSFLDRSPFRSAELQLVESVLQRSEGALVELVPIQERRQTYLVDLNAYRENVWFQILSQLAFLGWILAVLNFIWRSFDRQGVIVREGTVQRASLVLGFYAAWLVALRFA